MKRKRISEEQIIGVLKEAEAGGDFRLRSEFAGMVSRGRTLRTILC